MDRKELLTTIKDMIINNSNIECRPDDSMMIDNVEWIGIIGGEKLLLVLQGEDNKYEEFEIRVVKKG